MSIVAKGIVICVVGFLLLLLSALVTLPMRTVHQLWVLLKHSAPVNGFAPDGPLVLRAELEGPPDRHTPLGAAAAVFAVQVTKSDGESRSVVCSFGEISGVVLKDRKLKLSLAADAAQPGVSPIPAVHWLDAEFGRVAPSPEVPEAVRLRCGLKSHQNLQYSEARIESGTQVTVIGCRSSDQILACADGMDEVSRLSWSEIVEQTAARESIGTAGFVVAVMVMWGLVSRLTSISRQITDPLFKEEQAAATKEAEWKL